MKLLRPLTCALLISCTATVAQAAPSSWGGNGSSLMNSAEEKISVKDYQSAIADLRQIVADSPENADAFNLLGYTHRKLKRYEAAEEYYQRALTIEPDHTGALEYLGELYLETNRMGKAKEMLNRLDSACLFTCEEYSTLKNLIEQKESGVKVSEIHNSYWD